MNTDHPVHSNLIALCGVDGVGKSTLANCLRDRNELGNVEVTKRTYSPSRDLLMRHHTRPLSDPIELIHGSYATALSLALALDFLRYYEETIVPLTIDDNIDVIVADRHMLCYCAYLACAAPQVDCTQFFAKIALPRLTILLTTNRNSLGARFSARGKISEDEHPFVTSRFEYGYEKVLPGYPGETLILENDGDFDACYAAALAAITAALKTPL